MNSCPPPLLYLSPFQPNPHSLTSKIFIFFPLDHHSYHKEERNQFSPDLWDTMLFPTTFGGPPPLYISSQAHSLELSSDPMLGET